MTTVRRVVIPVVSVMTLAFAQETEAPLKAHTSPNPFFGAINAYQLLLYIPLHNLRHDQQIAEVKTAPDYPR